MPQTGWELADTFRENGQFPRSLAQPQRNSSGIRCLRGTVYRDSLYCPWILREAPRRERSRLRLRELAKFRQARVVNGPVLVLGEMGMKDRVAVKRLD